MRYINNFFKPQFVLSLLSIIFFVSCNQNQVFSENNRDFPMNRWLKVDVQEFQPKIVDVASSYNLYLNFGHIYEFQFESIPVEVIVKSPSGTTEHFKVRLQVLDENKKDVGDCVGDICDLKHLVKEGMVFKEKGTYIISVQNRFNNSFVPNVLAVGVSIEKQQ